MHNRNELVIAAISKNESRYLEEWVAYHLAIGVSRIIVYDNESNDNSYEVLTRLSAAGLPVTVRHWPSVDRASPQRSAYSDALRSIYLEEFIAFIDIDEFIVPWAYSDIPDFLSKIPSEASAVALSWRTFGSSGRVDPVYESVLKSFVYCSGQASPNNKHVKTIARCRDIEEPFIHHVRLKRGITVSSDFKTANFESDGKMTYPIYNGIQVNHYQTKTRTEFFERMARGNANFPPNHPSRKREVSEKRFSDLDKNEETDMKISRFLILMDNKLDFIRKLG